MPEYSTRSIDSFIRASLSDDYRVNSDCIDAVRNAMEAYVTEIVEMGWEQVQADDRTTIQPTDLDVEQVPPQDTLHLAIAPTRRISKELLPENGRMSTDAVLAMVSILEEYGETIIQCAELFMKHADRQTLWPADVDLYFEIFNDLPQ